MGSAASTNDHRVDDLVRITPELVLVDPELSRRVRPRLPLLFRRKRAPLPALHLQAVRSGVVDSCSLDSLSVAPTTPTG
jgi:hypothetical protein